MMAMTSTIMITDLPFTREFEGSLAVTGATDMNAGHGNGGRCLTKRVGAGRTVCRRHAG